jgi:hypothetical protein
METELLAIDLILNGFPFFTHCNKTKSSLQMSNSLICYTTRLVERNIVPKKSSNNDLLIKHYVLILENHVFEETNYDTYTFTLYVIYFSYQSNAK